MQGRRIRLDDDERVYIIDLIEDNNKLQGSLISLSIRRLLQKLGDDTYQAGKARLRRDFEEKPCFFEDCTFIAKSGAGLSRHVASKHKPNPLRVDN